MRTPLNPPPPHVPQALAQAVGELTNNDVASKGFIGQLLQSVYLLFNRVNQVSISAGAGTPESAVVGRIGDIFMRTDGGSSTTLYVKESGADTNTGWTAK